MFLFLFVLHPFRIKYEVIISKPYVAHMGGVTLFVNKRYIWVGWVGKARFLALNNYLMVSMRVSAIILSHQTSTGTSSTISSLRELKKNGIFDRIFFP